MKDEINSLIDSVRSSQINNKLKKWLLELLAEMDAAINLYWVKGPKGFKTALAVTMGELAMRWGEYREVKEGDEHVHSGLMRIIDRLADLAKRAKEFNEEYGPLIGYTGSMLLIAFDRFGPGIIDNFKS